MHYNTPVIIVATIVVSPGVHDVTVVGVALHSPHLVVLVVLMVGLVNGAGVDSSLGTTAASCN